MKITTSEDTKTQRDIRRKLRILTYAKGQIISLRLAGKYKISQFHASVRCPALENKRDNYPLFR